MSPFISKEAILIFINGARLQYMTQYVETAFSQYFGRTWVKRNSYYNITNNLTTWRPNQKEVSLTTLSLSLA